MRWHRSLRLNLRHVGFLDLSWPQWARRAYLWISLVTLGSLGSIWVLARLGASLPHLIAVVLEAAVFLGMSSGVLLTFGLLLEDGWSLCRSGWAIDGEELVVRRGRTTSTLPLAEILELESGRGDHSHESAPALRLQDGSIVGLPPLRSSDVEILRSVISGKQGT